MENLPSGEIDTTAGVLTSSLCFWTSVGASTQTSGYFVNSANGRLYESRRALTSTFNSSNFSS